MGQSALRLRGLALAGGTAILFLAAAYASHFTALQSSGLEALWPSNAVVLAILMLAARNRRDVLAIVGGEAAAGILLHTLRLDPAMMTAAFTVGNVVDSLVAFLLLRAMGVTGDVVDRVDSFFCLVSACAGAGLLSATLGASGLWWTTSVSFLDAWRSWYFSSVLSGVVVTPAVIVTADLLAGRRSRGLAASGVLEVVAVLGLIGAIAAFVFVKADLPATFLIPPCILFATFRFRAVGAVAGVSIVTVVAAYATAIGHGPIALLLHEPAHQVMMLQVFIAVNLLSAIPVAALLNERDQKAEETRAFAEHFRSVVENIGEVIFRTDAEGRWVYLNPAWEELTGQPIGVTLGRSWLALVEPGHRADLADHASLVLRGKGSSARQIVRLKTPQGLRWVELFIKALTDRDGAIIGATGTLRDIDDRKRLEEHVVTAKRRAEQRAREATLLATTDDLTGIANRRAFMAQLDRELAGAAEFGWPLAVALFDVDHFKGVNDRYGHAVGDRVLQLIAARAGGVVRGGDMVGRLGGEEFGILMPGATLQEATIVAERLRKAMEASGDMDDSLPPVTISIGIACHDGHENSASLLLDADLALYAAKDGGRNRVRIAA